MPIYYKRLIAKLGLNATELPTLDAMVGHPKPVVLIAADLVAHLDKRIEAMNGKATKGGNAILPSEGGWR